ELLVRTLREALPEQCLHLLRDGIRFGRRVAQPINAPFPRSFPGFDPVADVQGAVGPEIDVGCQKRPREFPRIDKLKRGAFGLYGERAHAAVCEGAAKVSQEEMVIVVSGKPDAGIVSEARWSVGDIVNRRNDIGRLPIMLRMPELFAV